MTLAGWEPWLFDTPHLRQSDAQQTFDTYVRADSVLLAPGEAGHNHRLLEGPVVTRQADVSVGARHVPALPFGDVDRCGRARA